MTLPVVDADAFLLARRVGLIERLIAGPIREVLFVMTGRIARNELNAVQREVTKLEQSGRLVVETILARSEESKRAKTLTRQGVDRGEAEAIAWIISQADPSGFAFVSCDNKARMTAGAEGVAAWDVLDLTGHWHRVGLVGLEQIDEMFREWQDNPKSAWRPADFKDSAVQTLATRGWL